MIKTIQDTIVDGEFKPKHVIELYCPNCGRDIDQAELNVRRCNDCGNAFEQPEQHVSIEVAHLNFGGSTL